MAHASLKKADARAAYALRNLSLEQTAIHINIPVATLTRWKREAKKSGDDWDLVRVASSLSGEGMESIARQILTDYIMQHKAVMDEVSANHDLSTVEKAKMLSSLADSFAKTIAASKKILPETDELATALKIIKKLAEFTQEHYPQHGEALLEILEPFGVEIAKEL